MAGRWIKLHRSLLSHPTFGCERMLKLWILCLMQANWKPKKVLIRGTMQAIEVPRGSFITGRESLFNLMYPERDEDGKKIRYEHRPTPMTVWRCAQALEQLGNIKLENLFNRCTLLTIVNYEKYQDVPEDHVQGRVQPAFNRCSTDVQPVFTTEEREEIQEGVEEERSSASLPMYGQFEVFWRAYPRKVARDRALAEWDRLCPTVDVLDRMLKAIDWLKKNDTSWSDPSYIPYPSRFLTDRRWEDEQITARPVDEPEEDIDTRWRKQRAYLESVCGGGA